MNSSSVTYLGGRIFDGIKMHEGKAIRFENGRFVEIIPQIEVGPTEEAIDLQGDILSPGYVDLQVNGGGGVLFNDNPSEETLIRIAAAHRKLGVIKLLPTLITDSPDKTRAAIEAARSAIANGVAGIAGLHLEGPHLSVARKGAHDEKFIRSMDDNDLQILLDAKNDLPVLKVTIAPENVTLDQVRELTGAGILVSLGHTNAEFETCLAYAEAGVQCVTHLFNAMSQIGNREPGLVGAALSSGNLSAGLIADGIHVHPAAIRVAWDAKTGPGRIFIVSDSMAVAGSDLDEFELGGRRIKRQDGRLTLADGTLAGADLELTTAISVLVNEVGIDLDAALAAATSGPSDLCGLPPQSLQKEVTSLQDLIRISADLTGLKPL